MSVKISSSVWRHAHARCRTTLPVERSNRPRPRRSPCELARPMCDCPSGPLLHHSRACRKHFCFFAVIFLGFSSVCLCDLDERLLSQASSRTAGVSRARAIKDGQCLRVWATWTRSRQRSRPRCGSLSPSRQSSPPSRHRAALGAYTLLAAAGDTLERRIQRVRQRGTPLAFRTLQRGLPDGDKAHCIISNSGT